MSSAADFAAIHSVLELYLDGLYHSDTTRLAKVFHPQALYATAVGEQPIFWRMNAVSYTHLTLPTTPYV